MKYPLIGRLVGTLIMLAAAIGASAQNAGSTSDQSPGSMPGNPTPETPGNLLEPLGQQALGAAAAVLRSPNYVDLLAGLTYTSNAYLTPSNPAGDGIGLAGLDIDYIHQATELNVNALGNIERLEYLKGSFPGSFYGQFNGSATWGRPTDWLQWQLSDSFGEGMVDPLAAPTPGSLQTVNYAATGPYFNFNFGASDRLTFFGLYSRTTFQSSPFDSQSYEGGTTFRHALSAVSSFSLQATDQRTDFIESAAVQGFPGATSGYDTRAAFLGYVTTFARTNFSATAGYNTVNYGGRMQGSPLATLQFSRSISPFSTLLVAGQTGYSTLGSSLQSPTGSVLAAGAQGFLPTGEGANAGTAAAAPFKDTAGSLGWTFQRARTTLSLTGTASEQHYAEQSSFDQTSETASASLVRELGPTLSIQLQVFETFAHYAQIDADSRSSTVNLSLSRQFHHAILTGYAQWLHERSTAQTSSLPVASYDDERVGLSLTYDLIGQRLAGQP